MSRYYIVEKKYFGLNLSKCEALAEATTLTEARRIKEHYKSTLSDSHHILHNIAIMQEVK